MLCEKIKTINKDTIWDYLEGNVDSSELGLIQRHCVECPECLDSYSNAYTQAKNADPTRHRIYYLEVLAVRKAELERFGKSQGIILDIRSAKTAEDYFRMALGLHFKEAAPLFHKIWDSLSPDKRSQLLVKLLAQIYAQEDSQ